MAEINAKHIQYTYISNSDANDFGPIEDIKGSQIKK